MLTQTFNFRFFQTVSHVTIPAKSLMKAPVSSTHSNGLLQRPAKIMLPALKERVKFSETTADEPQQTRENNFPCLHVWALFPSSLLLRILSGTNATLNSNRGRPP
ncbi:uncharacterized protein CLUP02_08000 [Colletotrichum lupini]|uniref:Uncharacterized protein n=1 Tax=Colletotrichum lupini TaxID=145971 RepID=A0A9Q8SS19_9PEZI|nr:uncharacterized protein CLUP02_08000 [Colletotrichum lupini]UQC82512.1 hypothetical protein CLUP02_08000 [Colletotrichum lupini]